MASAAGAPGANMKSGSVMQIVWLPLLWAVFALLMIQSARADPFNPALHGTTAYGHNGPDALVVGLAVSLGELSLVLLMLRPWAITPGASRALLAALLLTPWAFLSMALSMHQGSIISLHFFWVATLWLSATGLALRGGIGALVTSRRP